MSGATAQAVGRSNQGGQLSVRGYRTGSQPEQPRGSAECQGLPHRQAAVVGAARGGSLKNPIPISCVCSSWCTPLCPRLAEVGRGWL